MTSIIFVTEFIDVYAVHCYFMPAGPLKTTHLNHLMQCNCLQTFFTYLYIFF